MSVSLTLTPTHLFLLWLSPILLFHNLLSLLCVVLLVLACYCKPSIFPLLPNVSSLRICKTSVVYHKLKSFSVDVKLYVP